MFSGASNLAEGVDRAFVFIFHDCFYLHHRYNGLYDLYRYPVQQEKRKASHAVYREQKLEVIWTVVPTILVLLMFYFGWVGFAPMSNVPDDAMVITAVGRMWEWEFDYGNGMKSKELVLPLNKAVRLNLNSEDINHSLFIPAFRVKEDVIPGYENFLWFIPNL